MNLEEIDLSSNSLDKIEENAFKSNAQLKVFFIINRVKITFQKVIILSNNYIKSDFRFVIGLKSLSTLNLEKNSIENISDLKNIQSPNLKTLNLSGNPVYL